MMFSPDTAVGQLAARHPATIKVFQHHGIHFCCGGHRTLAEACRAQGLRFEQLTAELAAVIQRTPVRLTWADRPLSDLAAHIIESFHEPLRQELPRLSTLADRVRDHGDRRVLAIVHYQVARFGAELTTQMGAEERDLFPLIVRMESEPGMPGNSALFAALRADADTSHADAGHTLRLLREITAGYVPPSGACSAVRALYRGLQDLDALMPLHVHLERHVLFPRAAAIADAGAGEK